MSRLREEMLRERAVLALAGETELVVLLGSDHAVLRTHLSSLQLIAQYSPRPYRFAERFVVKRPGRIAVAPQGRQVRLLPDPQLVNWLQLWDRPAHRAWRRSSVSITDVAADILAGDLVEEWSWA